jgi:hypothetical protein
LRRTIPKGVVSVTHHLLQAVSMQIGDFVYKESSFRQSSFTNNSLFLQVDDTLVVQDAPRHLDKLIAAIRYSVFFSRNSDATGLKNVTPRSGLISITSMEDVQDEC